MDLSLVEIDPVCMLLASVTGKRLFLVEEQFLTCRSESDDPGIYDSR